MIYRLDDTDKVIAPADFNLVGNHNQLLADALASINEHSGRGLDTKNVYADLLSGSLKNLVVLDEDLQPIGLVIYHVGKARYDVDVCMHVIGMYMSRGHKRTTDSLIDALKAIAASLGAAKVIGISHRKGWSRRMKPDKVLQLGVWYV